MAQPTPPPGTKFTRVDSNCVSLTVDPRKFKFWQYDVILPSRADAKDPSRRTNSLLMDHLQNVVAGQFFNPRLIYDGQKIAYRPQELELSDGSVTFHVAFNNTSIVAPRSKGSFQVTISKTIGEVITFKDLEQWITQGPSLLNSAIRARGEAARNLLQLIVRQEPDKNHSVKNHRSYFTRGHHDVRNSGRGIDFMRGIFLSVRTTPGRLILQVDTTATAVYQSGNLIELCMNFLFGKPVDARRLTFDKNHNAELKRLEKFLTGLRVTMNFKSGTREPTTKVIRSLESKGANYTFEKDGREMTVKDYYLRTYNIKVTLPGIVAVSFEKRHSTKQTIVPMELLKVVPAQICNRLPDELRSDMVTFSVLAPGARRDRIQREIQQRYIRSEYIHEAGINLGGQLLTVNAKRLAKPQVLYHTGPVDLQQNGSWNVTKSRFLHGKPITGWAVVNTIPAKLGSNRVQDFMDNLMGCCRTLGMQCDSNSFIAYKATSSGGDGIIRALDEIYTLVEKQAPGASKSIIIIVLLAKEAAIHRAMVKHWGDVEKGVLTQCLREGKFDKDGKNNQYWNNVALKINARLGGTNSRVASEFWHEIVEKKLGPFMVMGADVGHPSPGQLRPSVAGFVYSWDPFATKYAALTSLQPPRTESIMDLRRFVVTSVFQFVKVAKKPPAQIFFFRDGLSEGEYIRVATTELAEIQAGLAEVWQKAGEKTLPLPKITFMIVTKRHHAVFFPENLAPKAGPKENCEPGLVVDQEVTTHILPNFYLQSHSAIQGTSRSSHYLVLQDQIFGGDLNNLQHFAHHLCYNYAKATRSVSIPSPVYYADLVCSRLMFHLNQNNIPDEDASTTTSGSTPFNMDAWLSSFQALHGNMEGRMYFL